MWKQQQPLDHSDLPDDTIRVIALQSYEVIY